MSHCRLDKRYQLCLITRETLRYKRCAQLYSKAGKVYALKQVHMARFVFRACISRCRILPFCKAITAIVHHDVGHVQVAPDDMYKLPHAYRCTIPITRYAKISKVAVG